MIQITSVSRQNFSVDCAISQFSDIIQGVDLDGADGRVESKPMISNGLRDTA
jgi:hypothetical protein